MAERVSVLISTMVVLVVLLACGTRKEKSEDPPPAPSVAMTTLLPPSASAVPSASIATQPSAKRVVPPTKTIPKCTGDDSLWALDEKSAPFCAAGDSSDTTADCKGKGGCVDAIVLNDDGSPALSHNGVPIGKKLCKPNGPVAKSSK
jgi:hypothetical protein